MELDIPFSKSTVDDKTEYSFVRSLIKTLTSQIC